MVWLLRDDGKSHLVMYNLNSWKPIFEQGNIFRTEAEAVNAGKRRAALFRLRKWIAINAPFVPDWGGGHLRKYFSRYDCKAQALEFDWYTHIHSQPDKLYLQNEDDVRRFNKECRDDLLIYFGVTEDV